VRIGMMQRLVRRSTRLQAYDYRRPGAYFVTICTWGKAHILGEVVYEKVRLSVAGKVVEEEWLRTVIYAWASASTPL
jgi:REP-associated tyrosine transposase